MTKNNVQVISLNLVTGPSSFCRLLLSTPKCYSQNTNERQRQCLSGWDVLNHPVVTILIKQCSIHLPLLPIVLRFMRQLFRENCLGMLLLSSTTSIGTTTLCNLLKLHNIHVKIRHYLHALSKCVNIFMPEYRKRNVTVGLSWGHLLTCGSFPSVGEATSLIKDGI